ncbi:hypothetical protein [Actinocorallia populi]|uniref:hypothetical protein n=1 Tax=Actinocorallia populi TaxID=2079200 RepID=UPI000D093696|nr:hypothetical protein [Actinocorallia populi]
MTELIDVPDAGNDWEPATSFQAGRRNPAWQASAFQSAAWTLRMLALLSVDLEAVARRLRLTLETSWDGHGALRAAFFVLDGTDFVVTHHEGDAPGTHVWTRDGGPIDSAERVGSLLAALGVGPEAVAYSVWGSGTDLSRVPAAWRRDRTRPVWSRQEFWEHFKKRPRMFVSRVSFGSVTGFLAGYDTASDGVLLDGFREWLAVKLGSGWNLVWWALVEILAFPDGRPAEPWSHEDDQHAVDELISLMDEFFEHIARGSDRAV